MFRFDGTPYEISDDAGEDEPEGSELGSGLRFSAPADGTYYIGVSGFDDFGFDGSHEEDGPYALTISLSDSPIQTSTIPTTSTLGLLALAFLLTIVGWLTVRR